MRDALQVALADHLLPRLSASTLAGLVAELTAGGPNLEHGVTTDPPPLFTAYLVLKAEKVCILGRCAQLEYGAESVGEVQNGVMRLCEELTPSIAAIIMNTWDDRPAEAKEAVLAGIGVELERRKAA
jgi:hypothetical protein